MDAKRFDRWTRGLDARISRRALSRGIVAALVTFGLAADTDAKKKKKKKKRPPQPEPEQACAETCANGCCTSEFGDCIAPAQQGGDPLRHRAASSATSAARASASRWAKPVCHPMTAAQRSPSRRMPGAAAAAARSRELCTTTGECCPQLVCAPESDFDPELRCLGTNDAPCAFTRTAPTSSSAKRAAAASSTAWPCEIAEDCCSVEELCQVVPDSGSRQMVLQAHRGDPAVSTRRVAAGAATRPAFHCD